MTKNKKSVFAGIPRTQKRDIARDALTENVEVLTGQRGENRALLLSDLINFDDMKRRALINSVNGSNTGGLPIVNPGAIERPHSPVNLSGTGGFTFIALTWDHPTYRGHAYAEIYRGDTDSFSDSVKIATEVTDIFSDSVDMGSKYYYWVRFVNQVNMKGPTQGAAGVYVETQESAEMILDQIGGLIERSHLGAFLSEEISNSFDGLEQIAENLLEEAVSNDENADISRRNHVVVFEKQKAVITDQHAIAQQQLLLSSEIDGLSANLTTNYLTQVDTNSAISQATITLKANIEDENGSSLGARLVNDYRTQANTDVAISQAMTVLKGQIEDESGNSIGALLVNSYLTQAETTGAISQATSLLKATIEDENGSSLGAILANDYRTQADTDETISQVTTTLRASIEDASGSSVGAALQTLSETVASNDNGVWALWGLMGR
ncbi:hypothetical protein GCM10007978_24310 [Shewanella hanedai]|uniref:DUF1983 domain-containing protein n=1 Tax=Shewanella hanedai TaxID=25 RepID=A0A553JN09_SHEHA|nr:hypothetical protein [Shewanella hanedai]TRY13845.1 hypothetical protein FN961_13080 [Shewanella hanedai]GGI85801.1 hypothetical protein GCM10007978_24310 [Shewanella hanedai]